MDNPFDVPEGYVNIPQPFVGSDDTLKANMRSHRFSAWDPEEPPTCDHCDCKLGSITSTWPCGSPVPRQLVKRGSPEADTAVLRSIGVTIPRP
jgi:hypothetical protein